MAHGHVDHVGKAFCAVVRFGGDGFGFETGAREAFHKIGLGTRGPEGHFAAGFERTGDGVEAAPVVEPRVTRLHEGRWAVIHIEQDGIVTGRRGAADDFTDIAGEHFHTMVVEQRAVHRVEKFAIPRDHFGE